MAVPQERWCVVTGGRGFAARHLVDMLIRYEIYSVRIADLGPDIKLETHEERGSLGQALRLGRAQYISRISVTNLKYSKLVKGWKLFFIWLHLIHPLITTSCIIQSMC
ncbi:hypothetical protein L1887_22093 [Cichorium endivia]|nr:hypothetical protein L1887_22093 [Cichorium endivia]